MAAPASLRWAAGTHRGVRRTTNEDRYYADPARGIFIVIDGVGGHSAGEHAAEIARDVMRERLERTTGTPGQRLREAIALANNEIWRQSRACPEWMGMACVLTAAIIEDDMVTVGHVGDSRLYLLRPGDLQKVTRDHSPVGEREDRGEISEVEAMRHERRNEIYRDVGSVSIRNPDDVNFVDLAQFPMPADGALLLCSDGLTDQVSSAEIRLGVERCAPDLDAAVTALIAAANGAGGKDNVTVVLVAGPEYGPEPTPAVTGANPDQRGYRFPRWVIPALLGLLFGLSIGLLTSELVVPFLRRFVGGPVTIVARAGGLRAALLRARPGDVVEIPPGHYRERIVLPERVIVRAQGPGVTIASPDGGPAVVARGISKAAIEGVWIQGSPQAPLSAGVEVVDASPTISNVRITGAETGIGINGRSDPAISFSQITGSRGAGIEIHEGSGARIVNNLVAANGKGKPGSPGPGIEVYDRARPVIKDNAIVDNDSAPIRVHGPAVQRTDYTENFFGPINAEDAVALDDVPDGAVANPGVVHSAVVRPGVVRLTGHAVSAHPAARHQ
jgi:PPM family protein phosphatase